MPLQPAVIQLLLEQLPALAADSCDSSSSVVSTDLPRQILSQMRWLDHLVDAKSLTDKLLECLVSHLHLRKTCRTICISNHIFADRHGAGQSIRQPTWMVYVTPL
jgi:Fanconi anaemia protein FancD2 nuclease